MAVEPPAPDGLVLALSLITAAFRPRACVATQFQVTKAERGDKRYDRSQQAATTSIVHTTHLRTHNKTCRCRHQPTARRTYLAHHRRPTFESTCCANLVRTSAQVPYAVPIDLSCSEKRKGKHEIRNSKCVVWCAVCQLIAESFRHRKTPVSFGQSRNRPNA